MGGQMHKKGHLSILWLHQRNDHFLSNPLMVPKSTKTNTSFLTFFIKVIGEVGHTYVVQIIIDNASVMKAAGSIVEVEYPYIFWSHCVVHTLILVLRNICAPKNSL